MQSDASSSTSEIEKAREDIQYRDALLSRYRGWLRMHAHASLNPRIASRCDGSDVAQETLLRATDNFLTFRGETPTEFQGWLLVIQENVLTDFVRRHLVARRRSVLNERHLPTGDGSGSLHWHNFVSLEAGEAASHQIVAGERARMLAELVDSLPDQQKKVVRLRFFEGMTIAEIAELCEITREAVSSAIYRGILALKTKLPDIWRDGE